MNNRRWWMLGSAALAVVLLGGMAGAQYGPWCPWAPAAPTVDTLQQRLVLTDEQAQKVADLQKTTRDRLTKLRTELATKQQAWRTLWLAEKLDEEAIRAQFREMERVRTELAEAQLEYQLALRQALPADKWRQIWPGWDSGFGPSVGWGAAATLGGDAAWAGDFVMEPAHAPARHSAPGTNRSSKKMKGRLRNAY